MIPVGSLFFVYLSAGLLLLSIYWALMCGRLRSRTRHLEEKLKTHVGLISKEIGSSDQAHKKELNDIETKLATSERKNREYFDLIERVLAQRDERWNMFLEHSSQHLTAQNMLERAIVQQRTWLASAVEIINTYRRAESKPLMEGTAELEAPPIGTAKKFGANMEEMKLLVSPAIDAIAERDKISEGT